MGAVIEGATFRLRPWAESDLPVLMAMRNDVQLQAKLLAHARGSDEMQVRDWLQKRASGSDRLFFVVADRNDDSTWGYVQCSGLDSENGNVDLGICLLASAQGRGIGSEVLGLVAKYLRSQRSVRKISLRVRTDNESAIRCYRRAGYAECGILRAHIFIEDAWRDVMLLERFILPMEFS